jgi:hypothetical protein
MTRKVISLRTKLAAALCQMLRPDGKGGFERIISHEEAKTIPVDAVLARFEWDHWPIRKELGGPDTHWNLQPRPLKAHREKTAKIDIPAIAKSKRLAKKQQRFRQKILAKAGREEVGQTGGLDQAARPQSSWKSRPLDGSKRSPWKKKMNGTTEKRS